MRRLRFQNHEDLRHLATLDTPLWVFDVTRHRMWWANSAALDFWKAADLESLLARDFSSDTDVVRERLRQIVALAVGPDSTPTQETWTLYPLNEPVQALISLQPVRLEESGDGILIEVRRELGYDGDAESMRILEAARATAIMVASFTLDGRLLAQNPASAAVYGRLPAPGADAVMLDQRLMDPDLTRRILASMSAGENCVVEARVRTRNGPRDHLVSVRRGRDPVTGAFVAILTEEDVTEIVHQRERQHDVHRQLKGTIAETGDRLRRSEERFALAAEMAAIWDLDITRDRLYVSPSLMHALGYDEETFLSILRDEGAVGMVFPDDLDVFHRTFRCIPEAPDRPIEGEMRLQTRAGDALWYLAKGRFIVDVSGTPVRSVGILTDITRLKALEASLMAAQRMEAIGQLTGGIAHDFNNLLTVIQGNAQLLQELCHAPDLREAEPELGGELTAEIVRAVQRGAELTRHLLAFARQQTLKPRTVDLRPLMADMQKTIQRALTETITVTLAPRAGQAAPWPIWADPAQVEAALLNIAINARDAMPDGGTLDLDCANHHFASRAEARAIGLEVDPGDYVEISVRDTGKGMLPDTLSRAFEPFFTTKGVGRGSGLGLSMVLGFSRQSRGDTVIESQPDNGTLVRVFLPRAVVAAQQRDLPPQIEPQRGRGERVHMIEDDPAVAGALARILTGLGYRVTTSATASEALRAETSAIDVFIADVILPGGLNGVDFARAIRTLHPGARMILMSGHPGALLRDLEPGLAQAVLDKPIDTAVLALTLRRVLAPEPLPG